MKDYNEIKWDDFVYYDETSPTFLRWKVDRWAGKSHRIRNIAAGEQAGFFNNRGYACTKFNSVSYQNHRVIWILFNGGIDIEMYIDHIDGNKHNNSISNLRLVDYKGNNRNTNKRKDNTTGVVGVQHDLRNNCYKADWRELDGTRKAKYFSITKYGDSAFELACEYRKQMIMQLNELGAGYSERHTTFDGDSNAQIR